VIIKELFLQGRGIGSFVVRIRSDRRSVTAVCLCQSPYACWLQCRRRELPMLAPAEQRTGEQRDAL
jgi:hypothetical protein